MATSSFDRRIEITDPEAIKKLAEVIAKEVPKKTLSNHPYTDAEKERSREILKRYLARSKHIEESKRAAEYADNTDPFYSENNIRYLEQKAADYKANRLCLSEHQLIEDED